MLTDGMSAQNEIASRAAEIVEIYDTFTSHLIQMHPILRDRASSQAQAGYGPVIMRPRCRLHGRPWNTSR